MPNIALNNVTTQDGYTAGTTLDTPAFQAHANIDVANNSIYWQVKQTNRLGDPPQMATWQAEVFMIPGSRTISRAGMTGLRVRSAVAGTNAQVTVELVGS